MLHTHTTSLISSSKKGCSVTGVITYKKSCCLLTQVSDFKSEKCWPRTQFPGWWGPHDCSCAASVRQQWSQRHVAPILGLPILSCKGWKSTTNKDISHETCKQIHQIRVNQNKYWCCSTCACEDAWQIAYRKGIEALHSILPWLAGWDFQCHGVPSAALSGHKAVLEHPTRRSRDHWRPCPNTWEKCSIGS